MGYVTAVPTMLGYVPSFVVPAALRATIASVNALIEPVYAAAAIAVLFLYERLATPIAIAFGMGVLPTAVAVLAVTEARSAVATTPPATAAAPG
ncbi:hypothetical protein ACGF4C_16880 [Streptomyces sp. NPDC048197]|uniref:hypothetical protein n=1 Tax=Streptomyces sp. NPDC048197 TaxID=3365511 RepID=UPI00371BE314